MSKPKSKYYDLMFKDGRDTKEYRAYWAMISRCDRSENYVDRFVDEYFLDKEEGFKRFYDEIGVCPDPTFDLDRRENDKGYIRGNLRWISRQGNLLNRSVTLKVQMHDGSSIPLKTYCENNHLSYARLRQRYRGGKLIRTCLELA